VDQHWVQRTAPSREIADRRRWKSSTAVARHRASLTRGHHPSFVQLYYALEARRTSTEAPMVVQFVSASPEAGVSTVASGYACVAAMGRPTPVLFIDAACGRGRQKIATSNVSNVPSLVQAYERGINVAEAAIPARNGENLLWARLSDHPDELLELGSDRLQNLFGHLGELFRLIVLDSASIDRPEAALLSRYCDGSLLVLEAGITSQSQVDAACRRLKQFGGVAIGSVLNRERRALPRKLVQ
jgi:Mrp family chromosome partitioning ATPase